MSLKDILILGFLGVLTSLRLSVGSLRVTWELPMKELTAETGIKPVNSD